MNYWEIIGLFLNLIGTIILAIPLSRSIKSFHEDKDKLIEIKRMDKELLYTTERDKNNSKMALLGITLMALGFIFQLISVKFISFLINFINS